jgi:hypothetical protein
VLIGSGERLTGVLAAGHKLPRRTCEGSEQILAVDQEVGGSSPPSCTIIINYLDEKDRCLPFFRLMPGYSNRQKPVVLRAKRAC